MRVKQNGVWAKPQLRQNVGGNWKGVDMGYVRVAGEWEPFYMGPIPTRYEGSIYLGTITDNPNIKRIGYQEGIAGSISPTTIRCLGKDYPIRWVQWGSDKAYNGVEPWRWLVVGFVDNYEMPENFFASKARLGDQLGVFEKAYRIEGYPGWEIFYTFNEDLPKIPDSTLRLMF